MRTGCFQHLQRLRHRSNGSMKWTSLPQQRNAEHWQQGPCQARHTRQLLVLHMPTTSHTSSTAYHNIPSPTKHEQDTFFAQLHRACPNAVVLSLHSTYSDSFVPKSVSNMAARHLGQLYDPDITIDNYADILTYCDSFDISVSDAQVDFVMEQTKAQSKSKLWFTMRAGRVTASAFHAACHTRIEKPAMSLLRAICSPNDQFFFCSH